MGQAGSPLFNAKKKSDGTLNEPPPVPPGATREQITREAFLNAIINNTEIDPAKYAGEGWGNIDEYARAKDIDNPWVRADVEQQGEYYPTPKRRR